MLIHQWMILIINYIHIYILRGSIESKETSMYCNTPHTVLPLMRNLRTYCLVMTATLLLMLLCTQSVNISNYKEELVVMLSSARKFAAKANQEAQRRYKHQYDKSSTLSKF